MKRHPEEKGRGENRSRIRRQRAFVQLMSLLLSHMAEAPTMFQVGQQVVDQEK
jgi:hypothetical protein